MKRQHQLLCLLGISIILSACEIQESDPDPEKTQTICNTLSIEKVELKASQDNETHCDLTFDIHWENNWRTSSCPDNWDAAWIFAKYRSSSENWKHVSLSSDEDDHLIPSGYLLNTTPDGKGVYIRCIEGPTESIHATDISLRWDFEQDGLVPGEETELRVFGLEMVYIPEGGFYAGDFGTSYASLTKGSEDNRPWQISGEEAIVVTNCQDEGFYYHSSKDLWNERWNSSEDTSGTIFTLPAGFPKGYSAIYCMKYELSQQDYVDFLNTLTTGQVLNRYDGAHYNEYGYTIQESNGVFSTDHPNRACGFLSPSDGFAYADWAGLRPMTELEFEKICRGGDIPVIHGEFAWGTVTGKNVSQITGSEHDRELISASGANCYFLETGGFNSLPLDVGIFIDEGKDRVELGAGYHGVMEMSGNLNETCISIGNPKGREFDSLNGDGSLSVNGFSDEVGWPGPDGVGAGYKGGNFAREMHEMRVSERLDATVAMEHDHRHIPLGFRGVRSISE